MRNKDSFAGFYFSRHAAMSAMWGTASQADDGGFRRRLTRGGHRVPIRLPSILRERGLWLSTLRRAHGNGDDVKVLSIDREDATAQDDSRRGLPVLLVQSRG
jgi:hypothetical protein